MSRLMYHLKPITQALTVKAVVVLYLGHGTTIPSPRDKFLLHLEWGDAMSLKLIDPKRMATKWSSFVYAMWTSQLFLSLPFFLFFCVEQPKRGPFTLHIALIVAAICIAAGIAFAVIMWVVFIEPMRRARGFR